MGTAPPHTHISETAFFWSFGVYCYIIYMFPEKNFQCITTIFELFTCTHWRPETGLKTDTMHFQCSETHLTLQKLYKQVFGWKLDTFRMTSIFISSVLDFIWPSYGDFRNAKYASEFANFSLVIINLEKVDFHAVNIAICHFYLYFIYAGILGHMTANFEPSNVNSFANMT